MAHKSFLEVYVQSQLRTMGRKVLSKQSVERAIGLIHEKLGDAESSQCCTGAYTVVDAKQNNFLRGFEQIINQVQKKGNVNSLKRTIDLLKQNVCEFC